MCISSPKNGWCNVPKREKMLFFDYIVAGTQRCQTWLGICTVPIHPTDLNPTSNLDQNSETRNTAFNKNNP